MGIKFLCPNGHKLNVKSFLSGKKAICPKCGIKVIVPHETAGEDAVAMAAPDDDRTPGAAPTIAPAPATPAAAAARPAPRPAAAPRAAGVRDVLDEDPNATWYVRPPSGDQYGPAPADMMRSWLAEGRVTPNSLVWRSGWPDWRSAGATFPQLNAPAQGAAPVAPMGAAPMGMPAPVMGGPGWNTGGPGQMPAMGAPVGTPMGAPLGMAPMGSPVMGGMVGAPMGVPMGAPMGAPVGAPMGMPMGAPMGAPMGTVVGAPMGMPVGHPMGGMPGSLDFTGDSQEDPNSRRRRKQKKTTSTAMVATVSLVVMMILLAIVLVLVLQKQANDKRLQEEMESEAWTAPQVPHALFVDRRLDATDSPTCGRLFI